MHWTEGAYQATILDLLDAQLSKAVWVVSQIQGVKRSTGVQLVKTLNSWPATVGTVGLSTSHENDLHAFLVTSQFTPLLQPRAAGGKDNLLTSVPAIIMG